MNLTKGGNTRSVGTELFYFVLIIKNTRFYYHWYFRTQCLFLNTMAYRDLFNNRFFFNFNKNY